MQIFTTASSLKEFKIHGAYSILPVKENFKEFRKMSESVKQLNDLTAIGSIADYGPSSLSRAAAMLDSSSESSSDDESLQEAEQTAARVSTGPVSSSGALSLAAAREAMISSSSSDSDTDDSDSDDGAKTEVKIDQPASGPELQSFQPQSGPTSSIGLSMEKANAALLDSSDSEETSESEAEEKVTAKDINESNDMKIEDLEISLSEDPKDFQGAEMKIEEIAPFEVPVPVHNSTEVQMDNLPDNLVKPATKMIPVENVDSESETETYASSVQNENVEVSEHKSEEVQIKDDPLLPDNKAVFAPAVNAVKSPIDPVNHVSSDKELSGVNKNEEIDDSETSHWSETSEGASELNHLDSRDDQLANGNQTGAFTNEVLKELEHRSSGNRLELTQNGTDDEVPLKLCNVGQHVTVYGSKYFFKYGPVYI